MTAPGLGPSPAHMPKRRRPAIPVAPSKPTPSRYKVTDDFPRRGLPRAVAWVDSGILLFVGTDEELPERFRAHYRGRVKVARGVEREVRGHSDARPDVDAPAADHQRVSAATRAVRELLLAGRSLPIETLQAADLDAVADVVEELKRLGDKGKKHGGEAEVIVLAERLSKTSDRVHIVLTNDGGASIVADQHGLIARHTGDVLAEFACADHGLEPESCWQLFEQGAPVSQVPAHCRPRDREAFTCRRTGASCSACDAEAGTWEN